MLDGCGAQQETLMCDEVRFNRDAVTVGHIGCAPIANEF